MHIGAPELPTPAAAAPARREGFIEQMSINDCTLDEPMTLSVRVLKDGVWKVGHRQFPDWRAAVMAAHTVMTRLPGLTASLNQGYYGDFATGAYAPKTPWWVAASATEIVSIWPKRYYENYEAKVRAGSGYPLLGDEHLRPKDSPAKTN